MHRMKCARSSGANGASSAACNRAAPAYDFQQHALPRRRQLHFGGAAVIAVAALANQGSLRHASDHFAQGAAIDPDMRRKLGQG